MVGIIVCYSLKIMSEASQNVLRDCSNCWIKHIPSNICAPLDRGSIKCSACFSVSSNNFVFMNLKIVPSTFASDHKTGAKTELYRFAKTNTMLLKEDKDSRKNISINLQGYFLSIGFCCNFNSY